MSLINVGTTQRLTASFTDWAGAAVDVNDIYLKIYDTDRNVIKRVETADIARSSVGNYYYDFRTPQAYSGPLVSYFEGEYDGDILSVRAYIDREWTTYDLKANLLRWVKDYCRDDFIRGTVEVIPGGVEVFLEKALAYYTNIAGSGLASESLGDYSVSFNNSSSTGGIPVELKSLLIPYRRLGGLKDAY